MANTTARWHGDNYQSRYFWFHAASLLDDERPDVIEVTFESDGPKAFDDVVVRYNPGRPTPAKEFRVSADYFQIKWHTDQTGHFGFEDLVKPEFISAEKFSILERLQQAKKSCEPHAAFHLVTTYCLKESDPLCDLIYHVDGTLRLEKLFDGTKTDGSRMGKVRKLWRDHLKLSSDDELMEALKGLHIECAARNLDSLREDVALRFRIVKLKGRESETTFIYDEAARDLAGKGMKRLDRETFRRYCLEEGWFVPYDQPQRRGVSIQVYSPRALPADLALATSENTLVLSGYFNGRQLKEEITWDTVRDELKCFLNSQLQIGPSIRLFLEAPSSLAFLAGSCLGFKSGASVEIVQTGAGNPISVWDTTDGKRGPKPKFEVKEIGEGSDIVLVLSLSRNALPKVEEFVQRELSGIDCILHVTPEAGPGQTSIFGGEHALSIASAVAEEVMNRIKPRGRVHVFLSAPNAVAFYLGQQVEAMGVCIPYEFDLKRAVDGSYAATFEIQP